MSKRKFTFEYCQKLAAERGGELRSSREECEAPYAQLRWACERGHEWTSKPKFIDKGSWCRTCWSTFHAGAHLRRPDGLALAKSIAEKRGGSNLDSSYVSLRHPMNWRCSREHAFVAELGDVRRGRWCPLCRFNLREELCRNLLEQMLGVRFQKARPVWLKNARGNQMELDGFCKDLNMAFEHHGKQHYEELAHFQRRSESLHQRKEDDEQKRRLCQKHGVALLEIPYWVATRELPRYIKERLARYDIEVATEPNIDLLPAGPDGYRLAELRQAAQDAGGLLLTERYLGATVKHRFRCASGHEWQALPGNVAKVGTWCPTCKPNRIRASRLSPKGLDNCHALAKRHNGNLLSEVYLGVDLPHEWRCKEGHEWSACPSDIAKGCWCPKCAVVSRRLTLADMQAAAAAKGGACLSSTYVRQSEKLLWRCSEGHEWAARAGNVRNGSWCPACARVLRSPK